MGLGKRIRKPAKVILESDPSIIGGNYAQYKESLFDRRYLELDPTNPPTEWQIKQWTDRQRDAIAAMRDAMERRGRKLGIMCSLIALINWIIETPDGNRKTNHVPVFESSRLGVTITDAWMEEIAFPSRIIDELFDLIEFFSEVQLPLSRPCESPPGAGDNTTKDN